MNSALRSKVDEINERERELRNLNIQISEYQHKIEVYVTQIKGFDTDNEEYRRRCLEYEKRIPLLTA